LKKIITKKNHVGEHYSNPQCFKEKNYETKFSTSSIWKNKIDKDNSGKKIVKKQKKNHVEKHCSNQQCFKEKNYKAKFSTSSILKKIKSTKTILKKNTKNWRKKKKKTIFEKKWKKTHVRKVKVEFSTC